MKVELHSGKVERSRRRKSGLVGGVVFLGGELLVLPPLNRPLAAQLGFPFHSVEFVAGAFVSLAAAAQLPTWLLLWHRDGDRDWTAATTYLVQWRMRTAVCVPEQSKANLLACQYGSLATHYDAELVVTLQYLTTMLRIPFHFVRRAVTLQRSLLNFVHMR